MTIYINLRVKKKFRINFHPLQGRGLLHSNSIKDIVTMISSTVGPKQKFCGGPGEAFSKALPWSCRRQKSRDAWSVPAFVCLKAWGYWILTV